MRAFDDADWNEAFCASNEKAHSAQLPPRLFILSCSMRLKVELFVRLEVERSRRRGTADAEPNSQKRVGVNRSTS